MIKAIETVYDGYRFRSRLEARWAVFFNTLQIKYEYEKEGFDIDGLWYLPDFYLPDYSMWIEIKPESFVFGSDEKINAFTKATDDTFLLICGIPKENRYTIRLLSGLHEDFGEPWTFGLARKSINPELWILRDGAADSLINEGLSTDDDHSYPTAYGLEIAYEAATQARF